MRSGTSFFDWTTFKKTVCRFWPLWGVYLAGWLLMMPLSGLSVLRSANYDWYGSSMRYFSFYRVPGMADSGTLQVEVVFGALVAMAVFSHLYNARSANLFGSLPIRREGLFLTHYLAGLSFILVPNVIIFLLTLPVEAAGGSLCMDGLWFWLAVTCGEGFFFYTLAVFCAMFTGHILALPAFYAIINGLVIGIITLVQIVFQAFYYGFSGFPDGVYRVAKWFTPTVQLGNAVSSYVSAVQENVFDSVLSDGELVLEIHGLGTVGIYAIVAAVLAVCAFLLYRGRRLESAGDVVAVNRMKPVFKYGVALCAGLAFGMGTMAILYGGEVMLMIAIVFWGIVGYFAAEMLLQKSFKVFKKWKGAAAVTAVFIALFIVVGLDLTGYETRIPDPDSVVSVYVRGLSVAYLDDDGDSFYADVADPDAIRMITLLHQTAVDQRDEETQTLAQLGGASTSLNVIYHLKNGGSLSRQYYNVWVRPDEVDREGTGAWALQQLYNNRELYWQAYGFDRLESYLAKGGRLAEAEHQFYGDDGWMSVCYYGADAEALLAAVKEDFFAGRIGARRVMADRWGGYDWENGEYLTFSSDIGEDYEYYAIRIFLSDTASSTLAALEEMAGQAAVQNGTGHYPRYGGEYSGGPATMFVG